MGQFGYFATPAEGLRISDVNNLAFMVNGRLRYVDGQCWLDAGKDGYVPLAIIGHHDVVTTGDGESVRLDGQRVRVTVVFLDTVEP